MLHALLLPLALAQQQGPMHADLHPKESDLYLEISDMPGLWKAYEQAPVVQLLRDERLGALLEGMGVQLDPSPRALAKKGLDRALAGAQVDDWLEGLTGLSLSLTATGPAEGAPPFAFQAVVDFAEPAQAALLESVLLARVPAHEALPSTIPGVERLVFGEGPEQRLWCWCLGPRLVVGGGSATPEDFAARAERKQAGLDRRTLADALPQSSGTTVFWFRLSRSLRDVTRSLLPEEDEARELWEQIPDDLHLLGGPRVARMQALGSRFVTEMFAPQPDEQAGAPVDPAWLEPVPSGAMFVYATAFDGKAAGELLRSLLAKDEARAADLAQIEQELGFGLERPLGRLGPALTVYALPLAGLALPETHAWVDCDDPPAFQAELEALAAALGAKVPGFSARARPYKVKSDATGEKTEVAVTTVTLPPEFSQLGPMLAVSPSFAPVGKKLVFALSSMDVKSELKRVHGGEGEPIGSGTGPLAARGFELPKGACSVVLMDWASLFIGALNLVKTIGGLSQDSLPFDVAKLPPPELFTDHLKPTFHYSKPVAGGFYRRNEASFGAETWLGLLWLGMGRVSIETQPGAGDDEPAPEDAAHPAPPATSGDDGGR